MRPPLRIVIADDEAVIRLGLRAMLEDQGYQVVGEAADGRRLLDLVGKLRPDLVFLDIKMPGLDGLQAAGVLLRERAVPVIILTAYADRDFIDRAREAGVLAYLVKPVRESDLAPAVEMAMGRFKEITALRREIGDLEETLRTRKLVERAKGILMRREGLDEAQAFLRIQRAARDGRKTMREVAEAIIRGHGG
ncbi:MAG: response regulator [Armatimonadota bacterium]|nr:response regulator [Armatimonadota bacterium]MDR7451685.1 response regulator [Armatimonadota bacterium]MDR7465697.1 response regulator [Armatimonadota bacterium]MDR7493606.1 response regulator [Armatimonadota bacterium]MDR7499490.1 response regulator [Armatimonadota bacterium]